MSTPGSSSTPPRHFGPPRRRGPNAKSCAPCLTPDRSAERKALVPHTPPRSERLRRRRSRPARSVKDPRVPKNASIDIPHYLKQATIAESALFDAFFIVDSQFINATYPAHYLNRLEPLTLLSAVATHTTNIGLIATASSTYNSPFNLARRFASLDQISNGRAGWNVVTSFDSQVSKNFGLDEHLDYATRYGRAREFVEVARGLWDSYEDDAFPADVERGEGVVLVRVQIGRAHV